MTDNPYDRILPPSALDKAVEAAIEAQNARFLADPEAQAQAQAREVGERWRHIVEAEQAAGHHAVVLPMATAEAILRALQGKPNDLDQFSAGLTERMLADALKKAEERS